MSLGLIILSQVVMRCGFYGPAGKVFKRLKDEERTYEL